MGMTSAFVQGSADFSGMSDNALNDQLYISAVIHKAYVDVNEAGTEAAAATAVVMEGRSAKPEKLTEFRADHPFIFVIRHEATGTILFVGRVMNPAETQEEIPPENM